MIKATNLVCYILFVGPYQGISLPSDNDFERGIISAFNRT